MADAENLIEQVPQHNVRYFDDGKNEKLALAVQLPGVESAADLEVLVQPRRISVRVPGKYKLELPLDVFPIQEKPVLLRFVKKKSVLKAEFLALQLDAAYDAELAPAGTPIKKGREQQPPVHASFFPSSAAGSNGAGKLRHQQQNPMQQTHTIRKPHQKSNGFDAKGSNPAVATCLPTDDATGISNGSSHYSRHPEAAGCRQQGPASHSSSSSSSNAVSESGAGVWSSASDRSSLPAARSSGRMESSSNDSLSPSSAQQGPNPAAKLADAANIVPGPSSSSQAADCGNHVLSEHQAQKPANMPLPSNDSNLYDAAKQNANQEAAIECMRRAKELFKVGENDRAWKLVWKAKSLSPATAALLETDAASQPGQQQQQQQQECNGHQPSQQELKQAAPQAKGTASTGSSARATSSTDGTMPHGTCQQCTASPQPHQQMPQDSAASAPSCGPSSSKGQASSRPSQPYSFKPQTRETVRPASTPAPASTAGHTTHSNDYQRQQQQGSGIFSRKDTNNSSSSSKHAASERRTSDGPRPADGREQHTSTPAESAQQEFLSKGVGFLHDELKTLAEWQTKLLQRAELERWNLVLVLVLACLHWGLLLFLETVNAGTAVLFLLSVYCSRPLQLHRPVMRVATYIYSRRPLRWLAALPVAMLLVGLVWLVLCYVVYTSARVLSSWAYAVSKFLWHSLVWQPSLLGATAGSVGVFMLGWHLRASAWTCSWPVPLMAYLSGRSTWGASSILVFLLLWKLGGRDTHYHAVAAAWGVVRCFHALAWYKALPGVLLALIVWVISVAKTVKGSDNGGDDADGAARSSRGRGSWWAGAASAAKIRTDAPKGATGEIKRVLEASTHYEVLEVARDADEEVLRRAKRAKSLLTHPDKVKSEGAKEAFQKMTQAYDVLISAEKRQQYNAELRLMEARAASTPPSQGGPGAGGSSAMGSDDWGFAAASAGLMMPCRSCGGEHAAVFTEIHWATARYCARCDALHPARNGEGWIDGRSGFFGKKKVYICVQQVVFDITDYAKCCNMFTDVNGKRVEANSCKAPFKFSSKPEGGRRAASGKTTSSVDTGSGQHYKGKGSKRGKRR